jgi:PAS domain S-box-containing protein
MAASTQRRAGSVPASLILNVDDSDAGRYATGRALQQAGFRVVEAGTGQEAVTLARAEEPALVVLDVNLPDMSGLEVCARLRADPKTAGIPVLHLTATYANTESWAAALEQGADAYLTEPVDPAVLVATVRALLRARAAEAEVRRAAERWQTTFDTIPHGISYHDTDGTILRANRALAELYGVQPDELVGAGPSPPLPGAEEPPEGWPLERARESLRREVCEARRGDRWVEVALDPVTRNGVFLGGVRTIVDITERKRAEAQLQAAVDRLDSILAGITDAYFAVAPDWTLLAVNRVAAETIFQRPAPDLVGLNVGERYPRFAESEFAGRYRQAWAEGRPVHFDGHSDVLGRWFEVHAYPQADRLDVYLRDITDRKQAEVERAQILDRERAARLEAEAANRLKDEFLATLSHELRTPLNAIVGWAAVLRGQTMDPDLRRAVETIDRNARAQSQLIEDILDVSRIVTGKLTLRVVPLDLVTVVGAALESLRPSAEAKQIRLEVDLDPALPVLSGDPGRLQQVVWNLLSNSVKFTPARGLVGISATVQGDEVRLEVRDSGAGIDPAFLPHVFERFRQADASTTRAHGGLGLGLAIVRHLVELHGGTVEAESAGLGQGATFRVRLPVRPSAPRATALLPPVAAARETPGAPPVRLDGARILVVDDDLDTLALLVTILTESGARTFAASSAGAALETFLAVRPEVVISDIGLPGQDGFSLVAAIRDLPPEAGGSVPALALTAYARPEDRERALRSGFDVHLSKPIDPDGLLLAVARLVPRPGASSPSAGPD